MSIFVPNSTGFFKWDKTAQKTVSKSTKAITAIKLHKGGIMAKEITTSQPLQPKTVTCAVCSNSGNQYQRHLHWLKFPDEGSLVGHWREQYTAEEWLALQQDG